MRSYQGMAPHPDGVSHERLPMANVAMIRGNVDLPLPGIVKDSKCMMCEKPTLTHLAMAEKMLIRYPSELHHEAGPAPKTPFVSGMIGLERRH